MTNMIGIHFDDFKELSNNHRVYYFKGDGFIDFHYLVDGMIVKTTILESQIENEKQFFSDPLFYGAKQLTFRLPEPKINFFEEVTQSRALINIEDAQDEEVKKTDIQQEGVE